MPATPDPTQLNELLVSHVPFVFWLANRRHRAQEATRAGVDAEDVAQEILLRAVKNLRRYDATRGTFGTWLSVLARNVTWEVRNRVVVEQCDAQFVGSIMEAAGEQRDRFASIADPDAIDPAAGVALVRVLVPVEELTLGAVSLAWVRDVRSGKRVQVPAADVITYCGRLFAVAVSFDEGDDQLHRVRFGNDSVAWVMAAVSE